MSLVGEFRLAARTLRRTPGSALIAVLALGLGIGLSSVVFSIIHGAMLRGLPLPQGEEIVRIDRFVPASGAVMWPTIHDVAAWSEGARTFDGIGAYLTQSLNLSGGGVDEVPERVAGARVTPSVLRLLGVQPVVGRLFTDADDVEGAPPVILLGWDVWQRRFGGAADVQGRTMDVNGEETVIVGVLPEGFGFPERHDAWQPLRQDARRSAWAEAGALLAVGRLADGVSAEEATADLGAVAQRLAREHPETHEGTTVRVRSYTEFSGQDRAMLFVMVGAVLAVLLIACVNVANLLIGRAIVRTKEVGIRTALGASRLQVALPFLTESALLATLGALLGTAVAALGIRIFNRAVEIQSPPFWIWFTLDGAVLAFVACAGVLCALMAGVVPALQAARLRLQDTLKDESRGASSFRLGRLSRGLVIAEIALSVGLLTGAGLMIRSVLQLNTLDLGVPSDEVLTAGIALLGTRWDDGAARARFAGDLHGRLSDLPGVQAAALSIGLPGTGSGSMWIEIEGRQSVDGESRVIAASPVVSPGYFDLFEAAPVRGRDFTASDIEGSERVAIVNEAFERRWFEGRDAVGQRIRPGSGNAPWLTIVGVVPDLLESGIQNDRPEAFYRPIAQAVPRALTLIVRAGGVPLEQVAAVRAQVRALDPELPIHTVRSLRTAVSNANFRYGIFGSLFAAFGIAALVLASVGLYGVMSFSVGQRRREVGVRMAIGARTADVMRLVLRQGLRQVAIGLVIGAGFAFLLSRLIVAFLFRVSPQDPATLLGIAFMLTVVALLACGIPALRATRIDPLEALRSE